MMGKLTTVLEELPYIRDAEIRALAAIRGKHRIADENDVIQRH